jgi:imidazole glycerol-phosphate synthase subunit HisF
MRRVRVIPVLLLQKGGLVKSVKFKDHKYVGDPINAVKIFNEKEVDEIVVLDISATAEKRPPNLSQVKDLASEAFMPLAYGGGITSLQEIKELITCGVEKVVLNTAAYKNPSLITEGAKWVGSQSIVVSIDVKKNIWGKYKVHVQSGSKQIETDVLTYAKQAEEAGAGEIFLNSIDKDGTFEGYDELLIQMVASAVHIPVVAIGGAGQIRDFTNAVHKGASAVAAGSLFVFQRPHRAVLISYPSQNDLKEKLFTQI